MSRIGFLGALSGGAGQYIEQKQSAAKQRREMALQLLRESGQTERQRMSGDVTLEATGMQQEGAYSRTELQQAGAKERQQMAGESTVKAAGIRAGNPEDTDYNLIWMDEAGNTFNNTAIENAKKGRLGPNDPQPVGKLKLIGQRDIGGGRMGKLESVPTVKPTDEYETGSFKRVVDPDTKETLEYETRRNKTTNMEEVRDPETGMWIPVIPGVGPVKKYDKLLSDVKRISEQTGIDERKVFRDIITNRPDLYGVGL